MYHLSLCRICAKHKSENADNIFEENHEKTLRRIEKLTGKRLTNADDLPQHICAACSAALEQAYAFRVRCITVQYYFSTTHYKEKLHAAVRWPMSIDNGRFSGIQATPAVPNQSSVECEIINVESNKILCTNIVNSCEDNDKISSDNVVENYGNNGNCSSYRSTEVATNKVTFDGNPEINMKKHTESKTHKMYVCDLCGKCLSNRSHFVIHMRRHSGLKPYQCDVCPDKFVTISDLTRHKRRHTGERPFACCHCGKRFTDYSTRRKHENIHNNARPCKCTHCSKSFRDAYALRTHIIGHTGEYNFHCVTCNKSFLRKHFLHKHYRSKAHKEAEKKQQETANN